MRMIIIQHEKSLLKLLPSYYTAYTLSRKIRFVHLKNDINYSGILSSF